MPLFGTRKLERFEENIGALSVQLTGDDMATTPIAGARYPDENMRLRWFVKRAAMQTQRLVILAGAALLFGRATCEPQSRTMPILTGRS